MNEGMCESVMPMSYREPGKLDNLRCPACGQKGNNRVISFERDYHDSDGNYVGTVKYLSVTCWTCRKEWFINTGDYFTKEE